MNILAIIKRKRIVLFLCCTLAVVLVGCSGLDPTEVTNPQTTEENLASGSNGATVPFLVGIEEKYGDMTEDVTYYTDTVSDNYDNTSTFISPLADLPASIKSIDLTLNSQGTNSGSPYLEAVELKGLAEFALSGVIPNDNESTDEQEAEVRFYLGMAYLTLAENFVAVPVEEGGLPQGESALLGLALAQFNTALTTSDHAGFATRIYIARARTYRMLGDKTNAAAQADLAIAEGPSDYVFSAIYDAALNVNRAYDFQVSRPQEDLQPLPRLDFLDPKYIERGSSIPTHKMEEAYLIKAETALADGDYAGAKTALADAVTLALSRPTTTFVDEDERPDHPQSGSVKADASSPAIDGLINARDGSTVTVHTISGSSLDPVAIAALPDASTADREELLRLVYLSRQEILFYEGRRMSDLGIRLPMMLVEIDANVNVNEGDFGTVVVVPSYIPSDDELDAFTDDGSVVTISYDMNKVLVQNRAFPFTFPF